MNHIHAAAHLLDPVERVAAAHLHPEQIQLELHRVGAVFHQQLKAGLAGVLKALELEGVVVIDEVHAVIAQLLGYIAGALCELQIALAAAAKFDRQAADARIGAVPQLMLADDLVDVLLHLLKADVRAGAAHAGFVQHIAQLLGGDGLVVAGELAAVVAHGLEHLQAGEHLLGILAVVAHGIHLRADLETGHGFYPPRIIDDCLWLLQMRAESSPSPSRRG